MKNDLFPDCDILHMEQRSDAWFEARRGVLTATGMGPWLLKSDKTSAKARETAICRCLSGMAHGFELGVFENEAMTRGTALEPMALKSFEDGLGLAVAEVGFCRRGLVGCSPDGLLMDAGCGYENKCPTGTKHFQYLRAGVLPAEYEWQVLASMAVTGASGWHFQSFHPGVRPFRIFVERNDKVEQIKAALDEFGSQLQEAIDEEASKWA